MKTLRAYGTLWSTVARVQSVLRTERLAVRLKASQNEEVMEETDDRSSQSFERLGAGHLVDKMSRARRSAESEPMEVTSFAPPDRPIDVEESETIVLDMSVGSNISAATPDKILSIRTRHGRPILCRKACAVLRLVLALYLE